VNLKAILLIVLICFASATTIVVGSSIKLISTEKPLSDEFQSSIQLCNGTEAQPTGEIDCPGGPT